MISSILDSPWMAPLGYPQKDSNSESLTVLNICGYIPIIGSISGIARLILSISVIAALSVNGDEKLTRRAKKFLPLYSLRGAIEVASCGVLFLIPDLIFTVSRALSESRGKSVTKP